MTRLGAAGAMLFAAAVVLMAMRLGAAVVLMAIRQAAAVAMLVMRLEAVATVEAVCEPEVDARVGRLAAVREAQLVAHWEGEQEVAVKAATARQKDWLKGWRKEWRKDRWRDWRRDWRRGVQMEQTMGLLKAHC